MNLKLIHAIGWPGEIEVFVKKNRIQPKMVVGIYPFDVTGRSIIWCWSVTK